MLAASIPRSIWCLLPLTCVYLHFYLINILYNKHVQTEAHGPHVASNLSLWPLELAIIWKWLCRIVSYQKFTLKFSKLFIFLCQK